MAESTSVALAAAPTPSSAEIARAEDFVRDRFLHEGEDASVALAPGSPRRRALERALAELDAGAQHPSTEWRRDFSLLLGLERLLSDDEPKLADGTVLSAHQVDALSGTLTALLNSLDHSGPVVNFFTVGLDPTTLAGNHILNLAIDEGGAFRCERCDHLFFECNRMRTEFDDHLPRTGRSPA